MYTATKMERKAILITPDDQEAFSKVISSLWKDKAHHRPQK